ncbi:RagB/SusD family nutrient uptake outer membrane protein [Bacteroides sp. BFG-257]|uniref:RagB/SusD family nutrient uptake outer membrane protein n=1 Tax=Bacteroides TaxID=816 RepID=UPI001CCB63B2|nr:MULTISPECIES: RagB/SusD family nutrient uptake outer membrane protein [Bacteroides]UBD69361.1 RagB/SusD family nutrient uptake outer membrane protein [Bacteroides cellulosilyticus]UVO98010.1 RagB/SusD family nutrient uptake outer membrane protein [Bacteroides sp. BFG-257]
MKIKFICFIILSVMLLQGCSDWLREEDSSKLTYDYYSTEKGIDAALVSVYSYMRWGAKERSDMMNELGVDLFTEARDGGTRESFNRYESGFMNPSLKMLYQFWENHYQAISTANIALQKVNESQELSESKKNSSIGELLFLRAYFYYDLVQHFGKIPLETQGNFEVRTDYKRASVADVYKQIITDLRTAESLLPIALANKGKADKYAVAHLLAKVYLTRASAETDIRGMQPTDLDSCLYYSESVLPENGGTHKLMDNFADLWNMKNMGNSEVIYAVQFTSNPLFNGDGNQFHLHWNAAMYEKQPGMIRDVENGRPYGMIRPTDKTLLTLFDRKNDSRFYKSFKMVFYANNPKTLPKWEELSYNGQVYFTPDPSKGQIAGSRKIELGDTAIYFSVHKCGLTPNTMEMRQYLANFKYVYMPYEMHDIEGNPVLLKHLDPTRPDKNTKEGSREWVRMRLGETYLIAAEAAGRKGNYELAAKYINVIRKRAAWADGEVKAPQYWKEEGGEMNDTECTYDQIKVTPDDLKGDFVTFILDERGRELLGEICRWEDLVRCGVLYDWVMKFNKEAKAAGTMRPFHKLRPIPQNHIDRLKPAGKIEEEQNEGYY